MRCALNKKQRNCKKQRSKQPLTQSPDTELDVDAPTRPPREDARMRRCIATGQTGSPEGFVRFVLSPDAVVTPDFSGKLPGRGAWVLASADALAAAIKQRAFARSFKAEAKVSDDLGAQVEAGLAKAALSTLGLGRRCGDVVIGFEKVRGALKDGKVAVLISARDGAADGVRKLQALARGVTQVALFDADELSAALGRDHVIHAAVVGGAAAQRFLRAAARLEGFRAPTDGAH
jgi:uncharacterized protein